MIAGSALAHQNIFCFTTKHLCFPQSRDGLHKSSNHPSLTYSETTTKEHTQPFSLLFCLEKSLLNTKASEYSVCMETLHRRQSFCILEVIVDTELDIRPTKDILN